MPIAHANAAAPLVPCQLLQCLLVAVLVRLRAAVAAHSARLHALQDLLRHHICVIAR